MICTLTGRIQRSRRHYRKTGGIDKSVEPYRAITREFARANGFPVYDLHQALLALGREHGRMTYTLADGIHLTEAGNAVLAEGVFRILRDQLDRGPAGLTSNKDGEHRSPRKPRDFSGVKAIPIPRLLPCRGRQVEGALGLEGGGFGVADELIEQVDGLGVGGCQFQARRPATCRCRRGLGRHTG